MDLRDQATPPAEVAAARLLLVYALLGQSAYYILGGIWPILHMPSFLFVTGPKVDLWLVKTVGALLAVIGGALGIAGFARRLKPEIIFLAVGSAFALLLVDVIYVISGTISLIYLLDAAVEIGIIAVWCYGWRIAGVRI